VNAKSGWVCTEATDEQPVVRGVDLRGAVTVEPELLLHRGVRWVTTSHAAELEDVLGVVGLTEGDAAGILVHLDAESLMSNIFIYALNFSTFPSALVMIEVVDVDTDEQDSMLVAPSVHRRLVRALLEAYLLERGI
jgi:hypothetical protein